MNIGLDARSVFSPRPRGTGRNLFDAYQLVPRLRRTWRFTLYHQRAAEECPLVGSAAVGAREPSPRLAAEVWAANVRRRRIDIPGDRLETWMQCRLPLAAWGDRIDLLHFPASAAPAWCPVPFIVTIHDLIPLKLANETTASGQRRFRRGVLRAVRRAVHIVAPSQATRQDLAELLGVPAGRVSVIPWAPDRTIAAACVAARAEAVQSGLRTKYGLDRPWLLNFSGAARRKNAAGLLAGWAAMAARVRAEHQLVLVGCGKAAVRAELAALSTRLGCGESCRILGFVPHEDLAGLLGGARAMLMPSLYEGFGLPILDAFACGVPVLTAGVSSMPEVAGDAAVYCDPESPGDIAEATERVLHGPTATELVRRGHARVGEFTWERTAAALVEVYERCGSTPRRGRPARRLVEAAR